MFYTLTSTTYGKIVLPGVIIIIIWIKTGVAKVEAIYCITPAKLVIVPARTPLAPPPPVPGDVIPWRALFVSSSVIFCSIRNWASVRLFGCPDILTIRFLVPGAKIPLLEICMFAPDRCWISVRLRPPGPAYPSVPFSPKNIITTPSSSSSSSALIEEYGVGW